MVTSRYTALLDERARLVAEGEATFQAAEAAGRGLTAEEQAVDDAREARLAEIRSEIAAEERRRQRQSEVGAANREPVRITGVRDQAVRYAANGKVVDAAGAPVALNANGLPVLVPSVNFEAPDFESGRDRAALKPWGSDTGHPFGEMLLAVHRAATGRGTDPRLLYQASLGANLESGADGGFLAQRVVSDMIRMRMHGGQILSRVQKRTTTATEVTMNVVDETSRATGSRHGGVQSYWVDAGAAPTGSRPKFAQTTWRPRKIASLGYATDELLADVGLIESVMLSAFADDQKFMVENAVIGGSGAGQPQGLLNTAALISVGKETGQAAATVVKANIDKMWSRLHGDYRAGAVWLINQDVEPQLDDLQMVIGTGGVPVYLPPGGLADTPFARLKGRPVIPVEYCPTLGTVGDIILVNLNEYMLIDRGDPQQATSMHVAFTTDETAFRVTYRVDGHLLWKSALTPFKGSNTIGPVVALATRS